MTSLKKQKAMLLLETDEDGIGQVGAKRQKPKVWGMGDWEKV